MGKEALGFPLSSVVLISLFPIFLSGVGIGVSVLGLGVWGFSHLPSFFDRGAVRPPNYRSTAEYLIQPHW